jgi:hypothetical protein
MNAGRVAIREPDQSLASEHLVDHVRRSFSNSRAMINCCTSLAPS